MTGQKSVRVDVSISFREYLLLLYGLALSRAWYFILVAILPFLIVPGLLVAIFASSAGIGITETRILLIGVYLLALLLIFSLPLVILRQARKNVSEIAYLKNPATYTFTDDGVEVLGTWFNREIGWSGIRAAFELRNCFVLTTDEPALFPITLKSFDSESDVCELRKLIRDRIGKRARLKK
jgi:hypothetical protein